MTWDDYSNNRHRFMLDGNVGGVRGFSAMIEHHLGIQFKTPAGYRREFIFMEKETGFHERLVIDDMGIHVRTEGHPSKRGQSMCLDWVGVAIVGVRKELGV